MSTTRLKQGAGAGAFVLAAALGLGAAAVVPAQSAVVAAVPTATTTTVTVQDSTVAHGEATRITVSVDSVTNGPKPAGKVELKVDDKSYFADLTNSGKVDFDLPVLDASTTPYPLVATFTPADAAAFSSSTSAPVPVTVSKDGTTSTVTARHNKMKRKIVAKNTVTSDHGQVPVGKVKFVLRRNGIKIAKTVETLNTAGVAKAKFRNVRNRGDYKVVSRYLGSDNFTASKGSFKITR
ncbi:Ig-like domain repeat protein [Nocardioides piscis]|uniref:Uncharacterized protein n=1 Tax=Nocardioides piscis TaxID=2714938 RepID=A0A6G7YC45_9ACTN|nr:Ig-like domain repeat protein [Nocardioides piscis]QIK74246.1 hypothetical protein G7071_01120 [Nocardioides piscis]